MNKWCGVGRLTKDPEIKLTSNQTQFCQFTLAVDRKFKDQNGQRQTDFINCLAWRQTAVFISKFFQKGNKICITGSIQTRSYEKDDGQKAYITEIVVDEAEFVENKNENNAPAETEQPTAPVQKTSRESDLQGELPFEI